MRKWLLALMVVAFTAPVFADDMSTPAAPDAGGTPAATTPAKETHHKHHMMKKHHHKKKMEKKGAMEGSTPATGGEAPAAPAGQ